MPELYHHRDKRLEGIVVRLLLSLILSERFRSICTFLNPRRIWESLVVLLGTKQRDWESRLIRAQAISWRFSAADHALFNHIQDSHRLLQSRPGDFISDH